MSVSDPTADICDAGNINRGVAWWCRRGFIEITQEISFYQHPTQVKHLDVDGACLIKVAHNDNVLRIMPPYFPALMPI